MKKSLVLLILASFIISLSACAATTSKNTTSTIKQVSSNNKSNNKAKIICPRCGKNGVKIVYGKPGRKTLQKAEKQEIYLGGCVKKPDSPKYHCYHCGNNWK